MSSASVVNPKPDSTGATFVANQGSGAGGATSVTDLKQLISSFRNKLTAFRESVTSLTHQSHEFANLMLPTVGASASSVPAMKENEAAAKLKVLPDSTAAPELVSKLPATTGTGQTQNAAPAARSATQDDFAGFDDDESDWDASADEEEVVKPATAGVTTALAQQPTKTPEMEEIAKIEMWLSTLKHTSPEGLAKFGPVLRSITQLIFTPPQAQQQVSRQAQPATSVPRGVITNLTPAKPANAGTSGKSTTSEFSSVPADSTRPGSQHSFSVTDPFFDQFENVEQISLPKNLGNVGHLSSRAAVWTDDGWIGEDEDETVKDLLAIDMDTPTGAKTGAASSSSADPYQSNGSGRTLSQPLPERNPRPTQVVDINSARNDPGVLLDAQALIDNDETDLHVSTTKPALIRPMRAEDLDKLQVVATTSSFHKNSGNNGGDDEFPDDIDDIDDTDQMDPDHPGFASISSLDPAEPGLEATANVTKLVTPLKPNQSSAAKGANRPKQHSPGLQKAPRPLSSQASSSRNSTPTAGSLYPEDIDAAMDPDFNEDDGPVRAVENQSSFVANVAGLHARNRKATGTMGSITNLGSPTSDGLSDMEAMLANADDDDGNVAAMRAKRRSKAAANKPATIDNAARKLYEFNKPPELIEAFREEEAAHRELVGDALFSKTAFTPTSPPFSPEYRRPREVKQELEGSSQQF